MTQSAGSAPSMVGTTAEHTPQANPGDSRAGMDRLTLAAFGGTVLIGGCNFVAIKFSNAELAPLYGAAARFATAAVLFWLIARALSLPIPRGRALWGSVIYGLLTFGAAYGLLYTALLRVSIGMTAVIMAMVPLFTLLLAVLQRQERLTLAGVIGGFLAIAGIGVLSLRSLDGQLPWLYVIAALGAAVAAAEAVVVVKGFPRADPVTINAVGMAAGALMLWGASAVSSESWAVPQQARTWAALGWLVIVGSVGLFYLFLFVIRRWTASATAYSLTLMPVVAVTLGALFAGEPVTLEVIVGAGLVVLAVYVGAVRGVRTAT